MRVSELIEMLQSFDPDAQVILSSDSEGNSYSPCEDGTAGFYDSKSQEAWAEEDYYEAEDEDGITEIIPQGVPAVVLWPSW